MSSQINDSEDFLAKWLSGELTPDEQKAFENSADFAEFKAIVDATDRMSLPAYDVEKQLKAVQSKKALSSQKQARVVSFRPLMKYAAAAIVVIGISLVYFLTRPNYMTFETQAGETETITLPDNSVVVLNSGSELRYQPEKFKENRILELNGEAFFEVTKGINFEVITNQGTIKVLGTSFNVRQRAKLLDVVCYTGKVNVSKNEISKDLLPGDGVRIRNSTLNKTWQRPLTEKPTWLENGVTLLEEVTLLEALNELKNVYGIEFESNNSLNSMPYDGGFPNNDIESALQSVLSALKIDYEYDSKTKKLVLKGTLDM